MMFISKGSQKPVSEGKARRIGQQRLNCNAIVRDVSANNEGALKRKRSVRVVPYIPLLIHTTEMQDALRMP